MDITPIEWLEENYDGWMLLAKFLSSLLIGTGVWIMMKYGFASSNGWNITFLNNGSNADLQDQKAIKNALANKIATMDANQVADLLSNLKKAE